MRAVWSHVAMQCVLRWRGAFLLPLLNGAHGHVEDLRGARLGQIELRAPGTELVDERISPTPGCRAGISEYATNERDIRPFAQNQRRRSRCMGEISAPWANQGMPPQARTIGPRPWEEAK